MVGNFLCEGMVGKHWEGTRALHCQEARENQKHGLLSGPRVHSCEKQQLGQSGVAESRQIWLQVWAPLSAFLSFHFHEGKAIFLGVGL